MSEDGSRRSSLAALGSRLARLRRRTGFTVTDRTLLIVGSVLLPLGVVLILLGWYGAAHTTRLFEEIPYLISGGMLGLALVVAGGFCYFGYFLARLLATMREVLDSLLRLEERFETPTLSSNGSTPAAAAFVATRSGAMYHRPDCPVVAARDAAELRPVAEADGMTPCSICLPAPTPA